MINKKRLLILLIIAAAVYGLLSQIGGFGDAVKVLRTANSGWMGVALTVTAIGYILAAAVYICIAKYRLAVRPTTIVQLASNFANRLLPAGSGALAVNYQYLRRRRHTAAEATAILLVNNTLGFIGNLLVLGVVLITSTVHAAAVQGPRVSWPLLIVGLLIVTLLILAALRVRRISKALRKVITALLAYRKHPGHVVVALLFSMALTVSYALCLLACARAVSLDLSFPVIFISMSLGVLGATVTPTPGGLGGAEAALLAALVLYGADKPAALAAVLLYRICTFWLPLAFGGLALAYARNRQYI